ncbi:MAG TPA: hypothetical protein VG347_18880 [Verrucomicrobiae bacterium]|nr:hypothetical protein [Verrucomicrobiae bacterium]
MKSYLSIVLIVVCVLLAVALVVTKRSDRAALDAAAASVTDFSNRLDEAHVAMTDEARTIITLSNSLAEASSSALTISNQLVSAQAINVSQLEQLTGLNRQVTEAAASVQALNADLLATTNQLTALQSQISVAQASLTQTNADLVDLRQQYALLQNRFQRDVAERLVTERKFSNPEALQAQLVRLKSWGGAFDVTADKIYAGLDVEVRSNGVAHVITPN